MNNGVTRTPGSSGEVFRAALRLGLTSFGGPVAHLGYFREEYVVRRKWVDEQTYADLVALCQFLPGPASSQVGISLGILRAGLWGGVAAWLGFTLPSALGLIAFGYGVVGLGLADSTWLHGLKVVAVAVVAQAVWGMARTLTPDLPRLLIALAAAAAMLAAPWPWAQVLLIALGGLLGWRLLPAAAAPVDRTLPVPIGRRLAWSAWGIFFGLLLVLPVLRQLTQNHTLAVVDSFFRTGSLVFGGGHVVLPLLWSEVVASGWVSPEAFVAGYGAAQAVPGPLFTFAAYLGTVMALEPNGLAGGLLALLAIFAPSFLLLIGALPFWHELRGRAGFQSALRGINAVVVGLLLAALYRPVWTSAVDGWTDVALAVAAFAALVAVKLPPWLVVLLTAAGGAALQWVAVR